MTECLNKTEWRQIKSFLGKTKAWTIEYRCPPFRHAPAPQPEVPLFLSVQLGLKILGLQSWLSSMSSMFEDDKKLGE
jgi:hypothetical protein